ncbi:MAG TPA: Ig-like domain-containing protein, partial [Actinomycetota bacterium]|nr:Ig-like domain-containing protein [Actinomycetota bacterium]
MSHDRAPERALRTHERIESSVRRAAAAAVAVALAVTGLAASPAAAAAPALAVTPNTWDVIGLDSSKPSVSNGRPNEFPAGAKVCNEGDATATNVQATWTWTTANNNLALATPAAATRSVRDLAPGDCVPVVYNVLVNRNQQSFTNRTRGYQVTVTAAGGASASTPANRELYVEKLIRQNRNAVVGITSAACTGTSCTVYRGKTYRFTLNAKTATQGYEQLQAFVNFPDSIFRVVDVTSTYAAPRGAANDAVYADACGWDADRTSPTYRSCVGPTNFPGGKAGGNPIKVVYTVEVVGTGSGTLGGLVYDFSGSSFHYNADFQSGANAVSFTAVDAADLSVTKSHAGAFARGSTGTYTLSVRNDGPAASGAVTVTDTLPPGLAYRSFSGAGWSCSSCSAASPTVTLTRAGLAPGASASVDVVVDVVATQTGPVTNRATVSQPASSTLRDPSPGNDAASDPTTIANPDDADVVLTKTRPEPMTRGGSATYDVRVRNDGPGMAAGPLTVTDTLPDGLSFASASGAGWSCDAAGRVVTCTHPDSVGPLGSAPPLELVVDVADDAPARAVNVTSAVAAVDDDPNRVNNVDVADDVLVGRAGLWIEKSHTGGLPRGGTGAYTILVGNDGPDAAARPRVVDTLPPGLTFSSASGSGWTCSSSGRTVVCDAAADLAPGRSAPALTIAVDVAADSPAVVTNTATACSMQDPAAVAGCPDQSRGTFEADESDNSVDDVTETVATTDLALSKSASVTSVTPGTSFTYTLRVTNHGPNAATNVTVVDRMPRHVDPASVTTSPGTSNSSTPPYCDVADREVTCVLGTIGATAGSNSATVTITARALASGAGRTIVNNASVFSDLGDTAPGNDAASAPVAINGTLVNARPVAAAKSASVAHRAPAGVDVVLGGSDADGDPLAFALVSANGGAAHGTVAVSGNVATYVPSGDFVGTDTFEYVADDGAAQSAPATVTVTLTNSPPELASASVSPQTVGRRGTLTATAVAPSDDDGDDLTYEYVWTRVRGGGRDTIATRTSSSPTDALDLTGTGVAAGDGVEVQVTAGDGHEDSPTRTASATVAANRAPHAEPSRVSTPEDTPVSIALDATDADGDALTMTLTSLPEHGALRAGGDLVTVAPFDIPAGELVYEPDAGFNGPDALVYRVCDDGSPSECASARVDVTVEAVNDRPGARDGMIGLSEDGSASIDLASLVSDVETADGDLDYAIVSGPGHGSLSGAGSNMTYTPDADFNGTDSFTYEVTDRGDPDGCSGPGCDAALTSATETVSITVAAVNDAPRLDAIDDVALDEDSHTTVDLEARFSDVETAASDASYGVESSFAGVATTIHPVTHVLAIAGDADFHGEGDVTVRATDTSDGADGPLYAERTFHVTVGAVDDAPVAHDDAYAGVEDEARDIAASSLVSNDDDADGDALSVSAVGSAAHGSVALSADGSTVTFTPASDFNGDATFSYTVSDGNGGDSAEVTIDFAAVNDAPDAADDAGAVDEDDVVAADVVANDDPGPADEAGQALVVDAIVSGPAHGDATILGGADAGKVRYEPDADFNGSDALVYRVCDDGSPSECATAELELTVNALNDHPSAADGNMSLAEDGSEAIDLASLVADVETSDAHLSYTIVSGPGHGSLSGAGSDKTYTPDANFNGDDSFTYEVTDRGDPDDCSGPGCDGARTSETKTVSISVSAVNDAPVAHDDSYAGVEDEAREIAASSLVSNDDDVDGDALAVSAVGSATHGSVALSGDGTTVTFTPASDFNGDATFSYTVSDGNGGSDSAEVTIDFAAVNDRPSAADGNMGLSEDGSESIGLASLVADVETGDEHLSYTIVTGPSHGELSGAGSDRTYTPDANFNGSDSFVYRACDGGVPSECATADVEIAVAPVNDRPGAAPGAVAIAQDGAGALDLAALASDVETADADLTYEIVSAPARGDASLDGSTLRYERTAPGRDADELTYRVVDRGDPDLCGPGAVCDAARASEPATVALSFANRAPDAAPEDIVVPEDERASVELDASDPDDDALTLTITSLPEHGTLRAGDHVVGAAPYALATGPLSYEPARDFHGADSFGFSASDGDASDAAQVSIDVTPVNDAPELDLSSASATGQYSDSVSFGVSATDVDDPASSLTFSATGLPASLALVNDGNGSATISGRLNVQQGSYTPAIKVVDASNASDQGAASVTVNREDAHMEYTGDQIGLTGVNLTLEATVRDSAANAYAGANAEPGGTIGDITKMWIRFNVYTQGSCGSGTPLT